MADPSKIAILLQQVAMGVNAHDRENPDHNTWGIGMAHFDIERLGLDEGEEILPGIVLQADGGVTGAFRVLCELHLAPHRLTHVDHAHHEVAHRAARGTIARRPHVGVSEANRSGDIREAPHRARGGAAPSRRRSRCCDRRRR